MISYVPPGTASSGMYHWRIDLRTQKASIGAIADQLTINRVEQGIWIRPGLMLRGEQGDAPRTGAVARSTDNGLTWEKIQTPRPLDGQSLHFTSPTYGICATLLTRDAGRTWHAWGAPFGTPADFYAVDSLHLFATTPHSFHSSIDGGRTWQSHDSDAFAVIWGGSGVVLAMSGRNGLVRSIDSGTSWQAVRVPPNFIALGPTAQIAPVNHPGALAAIARFRHSTFDSVTVYTQSIRSEDSGASWQMVANIPAFEPMLWETTGLQPAYAFARNNGRTGFTGFLLGPDSALYSTPDTGSTWTRTSDARLSGVAMANEEIGIATRPGELLRTDNGGREWISATTLSPPQDLACGLVMFDTLSCSAIVSDAFNGFHGAGVLHSSDGGNTWRRNSGNSQASLQNPFYWITPSQVYCAQNGQIALSVDSGRVFTIQYSGLQPYANSGIFDGRYLYYTKEAAVDTILLGRWRTFGNISAVPAANRRLEQVAVHIEKTTEEQMIIHVDHLPVQACDVLLVDMRGVVLATQRLAEETSWSTTINTRELPGGAYLVSVRTPAGMTSVPITIVR
ncbi:MAG TPA: hypothetical protein VHI13_10025 [Candidatus Kapabacteria bacterium]|nr:hypothetical protein [Candidatus Kapabacteria bacterium]